VLAKNLTCLSSVLIRIYSVLSRFKCRLFIPRDINGPLLAIKSLILYIDNTVKVSFLARDHERDREREFFLV
jgi:hypothetical protein